MLRRAFLYEIEHSPVKPIFNNLFDVVLNPKEATMKKKYDFREIEPQMQTLWSEEALYSFDETSEKPRDCQSDINSAS